MMPSFINQASFNRQDPPESLQVQLAFHKLLGSIFSRFHSSSYDQLDDVIEETLKETCTFIQADRCYLFLSSENSMFASNTYEWCQEGVSAQKEYLQNLDLYNFTWFRNKLLRTDYLFIPSVEKISACAPKEHIVWPKQEICSALIIPLKHHDKLYGFLGFDAVGQARAWSDEDINLLTIIANIFLWVHQGKQSEQLIRIYRQLANSLEEGILIINEPNQVIAINQAFSEITGYSYADILGQPHFLFGLMEADQDKIHEMHQQLRTQGKWAGTVTGRHKDGSSYPARYSINTSQDEIDKLTRYMAIFKDISDDYRLEQERAALRKQTMTAQKLNSLSAMSAAVVHEIAQPLNAIKVLVDGMLYCQHNHFELPQSEIFEKLANVSTEMKRIDEIIQSIRSYANSNQSAELSSCSWNEAVERVLGLLGRQLATHQIVIKPVLIDELPRMVANPLRLDEVLLNLLVNAMHALDYCQKAEKEIICQTGYTDKMAILEVADNAYGIDESIHELIFEPFFTNKQSIHGMGLGLSIVASIMTSLKGQVSVFNNDKGGATFRLELPIIES